MVSDDVVIYSEEIKREAEEILKNTELIDMLAVFGIPHVVGSYAMDLMYHPDIDIVVETDDSRTASMGALKALVEKGEFEKIEYGNFVKFPRANRPEGYILVLKTTRGEVRWEIEVWFLPDATKEENDVSRIRALLTPESKRIILEFKQQVQEKNISKHKVSSSDIYHAVFENNVTNFEIFIKNRHL